MMLELAAVTGSADLLVGLVLGLCIGLLVAPAFRSWQVYREWQEASREARLTERLLRKLEVDAGDASSSDPVDEVAHAGNGSEPRAGAPWPTSR
jgi:hypothetical protein